MGGSRWTYVNIIYKPVPDALETPSNTVVEEALLEQQASQRVPWTQYQASLISTESGTANRDR